MTDVRFEFERDYDAVTIWDTEDPRSFAKDEFDDARDEIYETVRDLTYEWKDSEDPEYVPLKDLMKTKLSFIHCHVWPLEYDESNPDKNYWDLTVRGDVHVRVKGDPPVSDVRHDVEEMLRQCCGDTRITFV